MPDKWSMSNTNNVVELKNYLKKNIPSRELTKSLFEKFQASNCNIKRIQAFSIDLFIVGMIKTSIDFAYALFLSTFFYNLDIFAQAELINNMQIFSLAQAVVVASAYSFLNYYLLSGRTIGKKMMKLTTVNNEYVENIDFWNNELSINQCIMRTLGYISSSALMGVMYAFPFMRSDRKSLSDMWSNSTVMTEADFHQLFLYKSEYRESLYIEMPAAQEQNQKAV
jgi:hypothetical protein